MILTAAHVIAEMMALGAKNEILRHRAVPVLAVPGQASLSDPREDGTRELIASHALLPFEELRHDVNPADDIGIVIPPDALPVAVDLDFEHAPYEGDRVFACTDVSLLSQDRGSS